MTLLSISAYAISTTLFLRSVIATIVLTGGDIISFNDTTSELEIIRNGTIIIDNDRIQMLTSSAGSFEQIPADAEVINTTGKIITPGFVDTHHHLWQSLFKTLESNDSLATYFNLFGETGLGETNIAPEDSYFSQLSGALESLNAGVTTIVDHAHGQWSNATVDAILQADVESGARMFYGHALHNLTNGWTIAEQMHKFTQVCSEGLFKNTTTSMGLAYDFFSVSTSDEIAAIINLARGNNASFITSHYVGGPFLIDNSPELLEQHGVLISGIPVILSHAAGITEKGMQILREQNQYIATTPESELQLLFDDHNATKMIQDQAALGVDTNFGFSADIISQARLWLQRLRGLNSEPVTAAGFWPSTSPMSVNQVFLLATRQGGLALRRPDIGIIAPGAKADIVIIDTSSPTFLGWRDPVAAVILHAGIGDIEHVIVDGKLVKKNFELTHPNRTVIFTEFVSRATRLQDIWIRTPHPDFENQEYMNVTVYKDTEQIDVLRGPGTGYGTLAIDL